MPYIGTGILRSRHWPSYNKSNKQLYVFVKSSGWRFSIINWLYRSNTITEFSLWPTRLRIPTGRRQTSSLFTRVIEQLNSGPPRTNSPSSHGGADWTTPAASSALSAWLNCLLCNWKTTMNELLSNDPGKVDSNFFCYPATMLSPHRNVLIFTQRMHKPIWRPLTQ